MKSQPAQFMEARDQALEGGKKGHKKKSPGAINVTVLMVCLDL